MTLTIENLPLPVLDALRKKARDEGRTVEQVAMEAMARGLALSGKAAGKRDLSAIVGKGKGLLGPEFDEAMKDFERIDEELWQ